jgi:hypothetical protein
MVEAVLLATSPGAVVGGDDLEAAAVASPYVAADRDAAGGHRSRPEFIMLSSTPCVAWSSVDFVFLANGPSGVCTVQRPLKTGPQKVRGRLPQGRQF